MITEETKKIYEIVVKGLQLNNETLLLYGINQENIRKLISENILTETKTGEYALVSVEDLYNYGVSLLKHKYINKANIYFKACHRLDPNNRNACLQLFIQSLKEKKYNEAYGVFTIIDKIEPDKYQKENNLYLFLLGQITKCRKDYQSRFYEMTEQDIVTNKKEEIIQELIINEKYKHALTLTNNKIAKSNFLVENILLKELLSQVIDHESQFKSKLFCAAKEKRYSSIVFYLESKSKHKKLNSKEQTIYLISKEIIRLKETKEIKPVTKKYVKTLIEAIEVNDYYKAKKININFLNRIGADYETDLIYILLEEVNKIIKELRAKQTKKNLFELIQKNNQRESIQTEFTETKEIIIETKNSETNVTLEEEFYQNNNLEQIENADASEYTQLYEEELAYCIKEMNMPFELAVKSLGLFKEQIQLIKLIYARDYYIEGTEESYILGDKLLQEIENNILKTDKVTRFLEEIKTNRDLYSKKIHTKKRIKEKEC